MNTSSRRMGGLLMMLAAGIAAGCSGESADVDSSDEAEIKRSATQAQMNDVSILYPLAKTEAELAGYLSASSPGLGGPLLPAKMYTDATGEPKTRPTGPHPPGSDAGLAYDDLKVVAMRIDPCFAQLGPITDPSSCRNQLRLIFQPVLFDSGAAGTIDGAVHAFYSLTRDDLVSLVKDVVALRRAQSHTASLGPLAVHPILASQGLLGDEAKGLASLVTKHAGTKNLIRFTKFSPGNLATRWDFSGFDVTSGHFTPMAIPTLPPHTTSVSFFAGFAQDLAGGFNPPTKAHDDMQLLGSLEKAKAASKADQKAAFDAALRIENPTLHSPETIDCASCHVAGPSRVLTGGKLGLSAAGNSNAFARDAKFVSASEMKQTTPVNADTNRNFHAFSYRDTHPMIAMRVVNETASVVAYLNGNVLK